jgi:hypothetical protein
VNSGAPILVTGMARSGTTWVGKMLEASGQVFYVDEPLNVRRSPGVFEKRIEQWYPYITSENEREFLAPVRDMLRLKYSVIDGLRAAESFVEVRHALREWRRFALARGRRTRPLVKEPHAVLSAAWFAGRLDCDVVVTVRHPLAVASSWKRLGWTFDFANLLEQPLLLRDVLGPFLGEVERIARAPADVVEQAGLLWRIIYTRAADYRAGLENLVLVRHEDLARDPAHEYAGLYALLGLEMSEGALQTIEESTDAENPTEATAEDPYSVLLDSKKNLACWRERLSPEEVERVREITAPVARLYYADEASYT